MFRLEEESEEINNNERSKTTGKMNKLLLLLVLSFSLLISINSIHAQADSLSLKGKIINKSDQTAIIGATVKLINIKDSTRSAYGSSTLDGSFNFPTLERAFYRLKVTSIGYKPFQKLIRLQLPNSDIGTIYLEEDVIALKEVEIVEQLVPVQQKGDTTQYNADAFKVNADANSSDLVKKMPGIVVNSDGVTADGETVEQVLLDGKRFFGQDPLLSLNTIPAEIVDKVLVYDEKSEQSKLTGFDDGNTIKTMNLITKSGKQNGQFGKIYGGYGERGLYKAGGSLNAFNQDQRITLLGMSNNINQQNFGQEDLVGVSSGRGGFRRGGNSSFITGEQNGITTTNSAGINLSDQWGKKVSMEGSYFFNATDNVQQQDLKRETFLSDGSQFYEENQTANTDNLNHRLNFRLDYTINENNSLLVRSNLSLQENNTKELTFGKSTLGNSLLLSETNNQYERESNAFNSNTNLTFQHKFKKVGRTVSIRVAQQARPSDQEIEFIDFAQDSLIDYLTDANYSEYSSTVTYTEPIGSLAQLSAKYTLSYANRDSKTDVFGVASNEENRSYISELSNHFESDYEYHQPSVGYSFNQMGKHYAVELAYQESRLRNKALLFAENTNTNTFSALLPSFLIRTELSTKTRLFARYSTSTTAPSVSQLQEVINNTNPLFLSVGNAELDQSYSQSLRMGIRHTNSDKNMSISNFSRVQQTMNYIADKTAVLRSDSLVNGSVSLLEGAQLTSPTNLDGYWLVQNNSTFGIAVPKLKNNLNLSANLRYERIPGMLNEVTGFSNTYSAALKVALSSNISKKIDYNIYYEINANAVNNTIQNNSTSKYNTQTLAAELSLTFPMGIVLRNDVYFQQYTGANASFNTQYTLWNIGLAKKFLKNKRAELELSVFDLLGQNQSFNQTVNARYLEESETQLLQQYLMLSFTYQLRNFKSN